MFDYILVVFSRFVARGGAFLTLAVLALAMSPTDVGEYGLLTVSVFFVALLSNLGVRHAIGYSVGKKNISISSAFNKLATFWVVMTVVIAVIFTLLSRLFEMYVVPEQYYIYFVVSVSSVLLVNLLQGLLLGQGDIKLFGLSEAAPRNITLVIVLLLWGLDFISVKLAISVFSISYLFSALLIIRNIRVKDNVQYRPNFPSGEMFAYGFPFSLSVALVTAYPVIVLHYIEAKFSTGYVGYFFFAYKIVEIFSEISSSIGFVAFSKGVKKETISDGMGYSIKIAKSIMYLMLLGSVVVLTASLALEAFSDVNDEIVFDILATLGLSLPFIGYSKTISPALAAQNKVYVSVLANTIGVSVVVMLLYIFTPEDLVDVSFIVLLGRFGAFLVFVKYLANDSRISDLLIMSRGEIKTTINAAFNIWGKRSYRE